MKVIISKSVDPKWKRFALTVEGQPTEWFRSHSAALRRAYQLLGGTSLNTTLLRHKDGTTELRRT